ncbi:integration host factor [Candidatus Desantisbacteria bacterium CG_4_10_14_0_8_um_filter_48_22]|uniref:Integration host factor n=1 Tax=Candidatus Desantisbacteria bacterium CG_4_10_14_0_8_um_filter_48_22 TaxID=1974543 RepID=A0A2M7S961_9BACT|nr:MAG: hypothetical protein AUJ67_06595 [Candidatus Desantisbacteria bacterium CG1_02_49_89]PIV57491.1 MAG: integration host factor [Candidatus Desantisbacteria bacterium CG02_land_8_20_14_3_00_49_13]PIZ16085.1 MAG: integration host factor [Candidatus Desantisbacteria bacterium CG_4_10_14_0_8_um_filter_48_22]
MTSKALINAIGKAANLKPKEAKMILDRMIGAIREGLKKGETIELRGLGTFEVRQRKSKPAQIMKTKTTIRIPARKVPYFKPGKILKRIVNK